MTGILAHVSHYYGVSGGDGGSGVTVPVPSSPHDLAAWGLVIVVLWLLVRSARRAGL